MRKLFYLLSLMAAITSGCNNSKLVNKEYPSGITTTGTKITCENIFISVNGRKVENNEFTYGERFYVNFDDLRGLARKNRKVLPGMKIAIVNSSGDTIMRKDDLYSEITDGFELKPFQLAADLTAASPIKSGTDYSLIVKIWDKFGQGTFNAKYDFKVKPNDQIITEQVNVTFDEIYIYSQKSGKIIKDGKIRFDDNIYIVVEGLKGFSEVNGRVFPGLSLNIKDSENRVTTDFDDLFSDYSLKGVEQADVFLRTSAKFKIEKVDLTNPLECNVLIWDKKSTARLKIKTNLTAQD
jgi:hypothetical protein